jgi:hypothetical protein
LIVFKFITPSVPTTVMMLPITADPTMSLVIRVWFLNHVTIHPSFSLKHSHYHATAVSLALNGLAFPAGLNVTITYWDSDSESW